MFFFGFSSIISDKNQIVSNTNRIGTFRFTLRLGKKEKFTWTRALYYVFSFVWLRPYFFFVLLHLNCVSLMISCFLRVVVSFLLNDLFLYNIRRHRWKKTGNLNITFKRVLYTFLSRSQTASNHIRHVYPSNIVLGRVLSERLWSRFKPAGLARA